MKLKTEDLGLPYEQRVDSFMRFLDLAIGAKGLPAERCPNELLGNIAEFLEIIVVANH